MKRENSNQGHVAELEKEINKCLIDKSKLMISHIRLKGDKK